MSDDREIRNAILGLVGVTVAAADQAQAMTDGELAECLLTGRWSTIEIHEAGLRLRRCEGYVEIAREFERVMRGSGMTAYADKIAARIARVSREEAP